MYGKKSKRRECIASRVYQTQNGGRRQIEKIARNIVKAPCNERHSDNSIYDSETRNMTNELCIFEHVRQCAHKKWKSVVAHTPTHGKRIENMMRKQQKNRLTTHLHTQHKEKMQSQVSSKMLHKRLPSFIHSFTHSFARSHMTRYNTTTTCMHACMQTLTNLKQQQL